MHRNSIRIIIRKTMITKGKAGYKCDFVPAFFLVKNIKNNDGLVDPQLCPSNSQTLKEFDYPLNHSPLFWTVVLLLYNHKKEIVKYEEGRGNVMTMFEMIFVAAFVLFIAFLVSALSACNGEVISQNSNPEKSTAEGISIEESSDFSDSEEIKIVRSHTKCN